MRFILLLFISTFSFSQKIITDSIQLYYPTAEYILNDIQKEKLLLFLTNKDSSQIQQVTIKGYTDFVGSTAYNTKLARKRTSNVTEYLKLKHNTPIKQVIFGELEKPHNYTTNEGVQEHRKTTISILSVLKN